MTPGPGPPARHVVAHSVVARHTDRTVNPVASRFSDPSARPAAVPLLDPAAQRSFIDAVRDALPDLRLLTDEVDRESHRRDETAYLETGLPLAVALPTTTDEVATLVRLCAAHGVPIVPRGAGTGLSGG